MTTNFDRQTDRQLQLKGMENHDNGQTARTDGQP